jgi:hypothetical protein
MFTSTLNDTFRRLKQRILAIDSVSGVAWGCFVFVLLVLAGAWLDLIWELSSTARVATIVVAAAVGLSISSRFLYLAICQTRDIRLARRLDDTGGTGGQIVSGLELQLSSDSTAASRLPLFSMLAVLWGSHENAALSLPLNQKGRRESIPDVEVTNTLSFGLARLAVMNAANIADQIPRTQAVPIKPVLQATTCTVSLLAGMGLISAFVPGLTGTEWKRFVDPYGDHPPYSATIFLVEPGNARVRYGEGLNIVVTTDGPPVDDVELVLLADSRSTKDEKLPMFPEAKGRWVATVSSVTLPGQYYVRSRASRSHYYKINVITVPQLEQVRFRLTPPAYTRDAVYDGPLPQNGLAVLAGTIVEVRARSNRPLSQGTVELIGGLKRETLRLDAASVDGVTNEVYGTWTIEQPGSFRLTVTDIAGQESNDALTGTVNVLKDHHPFVRLQEPPARSLATPSAILPVVVAAEDDYGVTRLQLFRSLNDSRALPMELSTQSPPARMQEVRVELPLPSYGLKEGDVIKLFARVEDNDPSGAKGAESAVAVIQIVSDEDFQRMLQTREGLEVLLSKYQEAERRMESLVEEINQLQKQLEKRDAEGELVAEEREQIERLAKRIEEEAEAVRESSKHLFSYDLDAGLNEELEKLANEMQEAANEARQVASETPSTAGQTAQKLAKVKEKLGEEKEDFEKGVTDPLEQLAAVYPLLEDQARYVELYQRQRDLSDRLESLKEKNNPDDPAVKVRMRDLETEQRKIREDLDNLLNDIQTHADRIPQDDPKLQELVQSAFEFLEAVSSSPADKQMADAEQGLAEFSGSIGNEQAKNAADTLEQFIQKSEEMGNGAESACESLKFRPQESLGDTLNQLLSDAGFGQGQRGKKGMGGVGGGYSARRNSLSNIGLYGQIPTRGNPAQSKGQGKRQSLGSAGNILRSKGDAANASRLDPHGMLKASGASEISVPPGYRGKVEQYFKRIAEETSGK